MLCTFFFDFWMTNSLKTVNSAPAITYMLDLGANLMTDHYFLQSTTTIGLAQAFGSQLKKNVFACVRQEQISYRTSSVSAQYGPHGHNCHS